MLVPFTDAVKIADKKDSKAARAHQTVSWRFLCVDKSTDQTMFRSTEV